MNLRIKQSKNDMMRRRGSTLLEFALVVPVLMLILLGIMEFGWYVKNQLAVANGTREGVRMAAVGNSVETIRSRVIATAKPTKIEDSNITLSFLTKSSNYVSSSTLQNDNTKTPVANNAARGDLIVVTTNIAHTTLTGFPFLTGRRINIAVTMMRE